MASSSSAQSQEEPKPEVPTSSKTSTNADEQDDSENQKPKDDQMFECNICLDVAKDAVVSHCGHLFCWPCLHQVREIIITCINSF